VNVAASPGRHDREWLDLLMCSSHRERAEAANLHRT
jgi:hypothetical protein